MNTNSGEARLILLCPAPKKYGTVRTIKHGTMILHSEADDVVLFADSEELAENSGLPAAQPWLRSATIIALLTRSRWRRCLTCARAFACENHGDGGA